MMVRKLFYTKCTNYMDCLTWPIFHFPWFPFLFCVVALLFGTKQKTEDKLLRTNHVLKHMKSDMDVYFILEIPSCCMSPTRM